MALIDRYASSVGAKHYKITVERPVWIASLRTAPGRTRAYANVGYLAGQRERQASTKAIGSGRAAVDEPGHPASVPSRRVLHEVGDGRSTAMISTVLRFWATAWSMALSFRGNAPSRRLQLLRRLDRMALETNTVARSHPTLVAPTRLSIGQSATRLPSSRATQLIKPAAERSAGLGGRAALSTAVICGLRIWYFMVAGSRTR